MLLLLQVYQVSIRAQLENVTNLHAPGDDFQYCIKVKSERANCQSIHHSFSQALVISIDTESAYGIVFLSAVHYTNLSHLNSCWSHWQTKCNSCNEVTEKWQFVSADEQVDIPGSRGSANYVSKCKLCNRVSSLGNNFMYSTEQLTVPVLVRVLHFRLI